MNTDEAVRHRGGAAAVHHDTEHIATKPQDSTFVTIIHVGEGFFYSSALTTGIRAGDALVYSVSQPYLIAFIGEMVPITVDIPIARFGDWGIDAESQAPRVITLPHDEVEVAQRLPQLLSGRDDAEMAESLNLSERQLRRVFGAYGRSSGRSLRDARLEAAR